MVGITARFASNPNRAFVFVAAFIAAASRFSVD
jgi:hypothetical protein